jgi:acetyl-CoA carboxylase carboxyltransferase component
MTLHDEVGEGATSNTSRDKGSTASLREPPRSCVPVARERINCFVDPGSPFGEPFPLAGFDHYDEPLRGEGLVTGGWQGL